MLSRSELALLIDGVAFDREITRLSKLGGGWVEVAFYQIHRGRQYLSDRFDRLALAIVIGLINGSVHAP